MNQTIELLQRTLENARMGEDAFGQLLDKARDGQLREELMYEQEQFRTTMRDAEKLLYDAGGVPHAKGALARAGSWMGIEMGTLFDHSPEHTADMVIQGATMGVIEMTRARNELSDADAQAQGVASDFVARQQDCIERMKAFL